MLSERIKRLIPVKVKAFIKMGSQRKSFSRLISSIEQNNDDYDILIGTPIHTNLGDHLITMAELQMMQDENPDRTVYEIPTEVYQYYKRRLEKGVKSSARVFINGGGWMGNLWPNEEKLLQDMAYSFRMNKVIVFPQTIYYDPQVEPFEELINRGNIIFEKCENLVLFVRDQKSYDFAVSYIHIKKVILVPDIALYYSFNFEKGNKHGIVGLCLREDRERSSNRKEVENICAIFTRMGFTFEKVTTMNETLVPTFMRNEICNTRLKEFGNCDFIITDRLHAMIFSFLSQTPCIVFDNKTLKVSGVYNKWLSNCDYILPMFSASSLNVAENFINSMKCYNHRKMDLLYEFKPIIEEVRYGRN